MPSNKVRKNRDGLHAETRWCSEKFKKVKQVGNNQTTLHVVKLHNVNSFGGDIDVTAAISGSPAKVKFIPVQNSSGTGVSDNQWFGSVKPLGGRTRHEFTHVAIEKTGNGTGGETINVAITVTWSTRFAGAPMTIPLSLAVTV